MSTPQHKELAEAYRKLLRVALAINDNMRREIDHAVFTGSTQQVDDLREAVNEHLHDWQGFLYPRAPDRRARY
jgi:hypothetical protein